MYITCGTTQSSRPTLILLKLKLGAACPLNKGFRSATGRSSNLSDMNSAPRCSMLSIAPPARRVPSRIPIKLHSKQVYQRSWETTRMASHQPSTTTDYERTEIRNERLPQNPGKSHSSPRHPTHLRCVYPPCGVCGRRTDPRG